METPSLGWCHGERDVHEKALQVFMPESLNFLDGSKTRMSLTNAKDHVKTKQDGGTSVEVIVFGTIVTLPMWEKDANGPADIARNGTR